MRKSLFTALATAGILVAAISGVMAASMVLNEFNAVAEDGYLKKEKVDPYFGRVVGNGGSWAEFVVIEDGLDITGWTFMSFIDGGLASTVVIEGAGYDNLAAGTLFTVAANVQETGSGWWSNYYAPGFVTGSTNCQIIIMDADINIVFGPAGEGVMPAKGIGSDEIFVFCGTPDAYTTEDSPLFTDGSSSSFANLNRWTENYVLVYQDLSELRGESDVPEPGTVVASLGGIAGLGIFRKRS